MLERSDRYNSDDGDDQDGANHDDHHSGWRLHPRVDTRLSILKMFVCLCVSKKEPDSGMISSRHHLKSGFVLYETRQTSFVALETVSNNIGMSGRGSVSVSVRATQNNNG